MNREWYDTVLIALFIFFATYKAIRLRKTTRLGWSFAAYNLFLAFLFFMSAFFLPWVNWNHEFEGYLMTTLRVLMVTAIFWCVVEVELSRKRSNVRDGEGQQT